jgi:hypothetical protein
MAALFKYHWYVRGDGPVATTEKVTEAPVDTVWETGSVVMVTGFEVCTVSTAAELVTDWDPPVTVTV